MTTSTLWSNPYRTWMLSLEGPAAGSHTPATASLNAGGAAWRAAGLNMEDRLLVERCLTGDTAAWGEIVRDHGRRVYNLCYRFTGRAEDAEDLSQEVFVRVYRNLAAYRSESGSFATWLTALTRNLLIDHYRRSRQDRMTESLDDPGPDSEGASPALRLPATAPAADKEVWRRELRDFVQQALTRLSPELREAVILRDLQDLDYKEIAAVLRVPEGTVKSRINRGRLELGRLLKRSLAPGAPAADGGGRKVE